MQVTALLHAAFMLALEQCLAAPMPPPATTLRVFHLTPSSLLAVVCAVGKQRCSLTLAEVSEQELRADIAHNAAAAERRLVAAKMGALKVSLASALALADKRAGSIVGLLARYKEQREALAAAQGQQSEAVAAAVADTKKAGARERADFAACRDALDVQTKLAENAEGKLAIATVEIHELRGQQRSKDSERKERAAATKLQSELHARCGALETELHALKTSNGMMRAKIDNSKTASERIVATSRGDAARMIELDGARARVAELSQLLEAARAMAGTCEERRSAPAATPPPLAVEVRDLKDGGRYLTEVIANLRELVVAAHVPLRNVALVLDICFLIHTGVEPTKEQQINQMLASEALLRLGMLDNVRISEANEADPDPWSCNSDTGNKRDCEREVVAACQWSRERDEPVASALACTAIGHDQSALNGTDVLMRVIVEAKLRPEKCAGAGGDSTDHAVGQREGLVVRLVARGLEPFRAIVYGCVRCANYLSICLCIYLCIYL